MTPEELAALADSVQGVAARHWGPATAAGGDRLDELWAAGAAQGWFGIGADNDLAAALAVVRALDAVACPLPVMDAFVASRLVDKLPEDARILATPADALDHLDAAQTATHVLTLGDSVQLHEIVDREEQPGLAVPAWTRVQLGPVVETSAPAS